MAITEETYPIGTLEDAEAAPLNENAPLSDKEFEAVAEIDPSGPTEEDYRSYLRGDLLDSPPLFHIR